MFLVVFCIVIGMSELSVFEVLVLLVVFEGVICGVFEFVLFEYFSDVYNVFFD